MAAVASGPAASAAEPAPAPPAGAASDAADAEGSEEVQMRLAGIFSGSLTANLVCLGDR